MRRHLVAVGHLTDVRIHHRGDDQHTDGLGRLGDELMCAAATHQTRDDLPGNQATMTFRRAQDRGPVENDDERLVGVVGVQWRARGARSYLIQGRPEPLSPGLRADPRQPALKIGDITICQTGSKTLGTPRT